MRYVIFILAFMLFSLSSPAFAQKRIIIEKATGNVVDVGDSTLQYDSRYFDNLDYLAKVIPDEADLSCNQLQGNESSVIVSQALGLTDTEVKRLIEATDEKARSLGYKPESMNFELSREGETFKAYYSPRGERVLGGELYIFLDKGGRMIRHLYGP